MEPMSAWDIFAIVFLGIFAVYGGYLAGYIHGRGKPDGIARGDEGRMGQVVRVDDYALGGKQYSILLHPLGIPPVRQPRLIVVHSFFDSELSLFMGQTVTVRKEKVHPTPPEPAKSTRMGEAHSAY